MFLIYKMLKITKFKSIFVPHENQFVCLLSLHLCVLLLQCIVIAVLIMNNTTNFRKLFHSKCFISRYWEYKNDTSNNSNNTETH